MLYCTTQLTFDDVVSWVPRPEDDHEATRVHHAGPYSQSGARNWACGNASARSEEDIAVASPSLPARGEIGAALKLPGQFTFRAGRCDGFPLRAPINTQ